MFNEHQLPILADTIPIFDEMCKRSARFITACLVSPSRLVQSVSWHSVVFGKFSSPLESNAMLCCLSCGWSLDSIALNLVQLSNSFFRLWYRDSLPNTEIYNAMSLLELNFFKGGQFTCFCKISNYFFNDYYTSHCLSCVLFIRFIVHSVRIKIIYI
jgi:hypothetical protein